MEGGPKISIVEVVLISMPLMLIYAFCAVLEIFVITEPLSIMIGEGTAFLLMLYYGLKGLKSTVLWVNGIIDLLIQQIPIINFIPMELLAFWITAYVLSNPKTLGKVMAKMSNPSPANLAKGIN